MLLLSNMSQAPKLTLHPDLERRLAPAYAPCEAFYKGQCKGIMRWIPAEGHVPRGYLGAAGTLEEIELVLVFAEPGDPQEGETHEGLTTAYRYAANGFEKGRDLFYENVRHILDSCWKGLSFHEQMKKVWMTESVLCSAPKECGPVKAAVERECGNRYLLHQLELLPHALVVALGGKAQGRLRRVGFTEFLSASAVAPPGCHFGGAEESWDRIRIELESRRK